MHSCLLLRGININAFKGGSSGSACPSLKAARISQALEQQLKALQAEMEQLRQKEVPEEPSGFGAQLQDLQAQ